MIDSVFIYSPSLIKGAYHTPRGGGGKKFLDKKRFTVFSGYVSGWN